MVVDDDYGWEWKGKGVGLIYTYNYCTAGLYFETALVFQALSCWILHFYTIALLKNVLATLKITNKMELTTRTGCTNYPTVQNCGVCKIFKCFWKKSHMLTKSAFTESNLFVTKVLLWNITTI